MSLRDVTSTAAMILLLGTVCLLLSVPAILIYRFISPRAGQICGIATGVLLSGFAVHHRNRAKKGNA